MERIGPATAAAWLEQQGWLAFASGKCGPVHIRLGTGLNRYRVQVEAESPSVGCAMSASFLQDVDVATFTGGLLWVTSDFPPNEDNRRFVRQVVLGCGTDWVDVPLPWFFRFDPGDREACFSVLSLALLWSWDACLVVAGRRLLVEADNDQWPSLVTDRVSDRLATALVSWGAGITSWPFTSRFVCS